MADHTMFMVTVLGLIFGATSVLAAIPGPNDPRYPDYIVNPPVSCTHEGSFHHPRNCSWYYRCVDRMKVGYFWTYHFECEPGTVFSDELDQCVHPFAAPNSCKSPGPKPEPPLKCEGVPGTCTTYDICYPSKTQKTMCTEIRCPLRSPNLGCGDGYAFDMSTQECAPIPTDAELCPKLLCEGVPGTCKTYEICEPTKINKTMCTEIQCPFRTPNLNCGAGYAFDMTTQKCASIPKDSELCKKLLCEGVPGTCQNYEFCNPKETRLLCREIRCPLRQPNLNCGPGYAFDMKAQKCVRLPGDCGKNITVKEEDLLPCAFTGQIPKIDFVVRRYCDDIPLCDNKIYQGTTELCTAYYECEKTVSGWKAHLRSCPPNTLFSFDENRCKSTPTAEERC